MGTMANILFFVYISGSIPMLLFIKNGEVKETVVGVQSKDALNRRLDALA